MVDQIAFIDLFKKPFGLTLNGKSSINTNIGGLATLFTIFLFSMAILLKIDHINMISQFEEID